MLNPCNLSSILRKQIVAVTGLLLVGFVFGHLLGNFLIFVGESAFNAYAQKLQDLGPALYGIEAILLLIFLVHVTLTLSLVWENFQARPDRYAVSISTSKRSLATRIIPITGILVFSFIAWHLLDLKFSEHHGMVAGLESKGLYARVYEAFSSPAHSLLYILAMIALGMHLSHAIQSFIQTLGLCNQKVQPVIMKISLVIGIAVAVLFSSIPIYILAKEKMVKKTPHVHINSEQGGITR